MEVSARLRGWRRGFVQVFGCDPRSLALLRMGLGAMILWDIALRWPSLEVFLSDAGPVDRVMATTLLQLDYGALAANVWSLHFLSGELWFQQALTLVLAAAAVGLALGWRTWWMTLACWILVVSLHMRCPVILSSGDTLLRCLLFWSLFAPLGAWWSCDAARVARHRPPLEEEPRPIPILTAGTAGLICQLFCMYFFAGLAKWNVHWWEGDAMEYVCRLDLYARPWSAVLLDYPLLLKLVSWGTLFAEVFLILLLLVPWQTTWWRSVNILVYFALHLSIAATMDIGLFPYISLVGWLPLFPATFYLWFQSAGERLAWHPVADVDYGTPTLTTAAGLGRDWQGGWRWLGNGFATLMIGYIFLWNISNIPNAYDGDLRERLKLEPAQFARYISARQPFALAMPTGLRWLGPLTGLGQHFQMFGVPPLYSPWFVYDATLADGTRIDLLRQQPVSYTRPESTLGSISGHHWRKLHDNLLGYDLGSLQQRVAEYLRDRWNAQHRAGKQVVALKVTCFAERTGPQDVGQPPQVRLWFDWHKPLESVEDLERWLERHPSLLPGM